MAPVLAFAAAGVAAAGGVLLGLLCRSATDDFDSYRADRAASGHVREGAQDLADRANLLGALATGALAVARAAAAAGGALLIMGGADEAVVQAVWSW